MAVVFPAALLRLPSGFLECGLDEEKVVRLLKNLDRQKFLYNHMVFKQIYNILSEMVLFSVDGSILSDLASLI